MPALSAFALSEDDLPVVLTFIALAALACVVPPQPDTFFHLRTGQIIWQSGEILTTEPFSHTFRGHPWLNHEWLSQLFFYGVYVLGGPFLLTIVSGACAFTAIMGSWKLTRGAPEIRLTVLILLLIVTPPALAVRPQVLSLALLMLAMWLVLRDKIAWLPALIVVWANAHGVVLLGVVIACVNALDALIWSRGRLARAFVVAGLCVAAPMATPLGWHYWPRVAQTVSEARLLDFQEYRSAFADASGLPFWLMFAVLASSALVRMRSLPKWDRSDRLLVLTSVVLGVTSIVSIRNAPSFALLAAPAISRLIDVRHGHRRRNLRRSGYVMTAIAIGIAFVAVALSWREGGALLGWRPIPSMAMRAIRNCAGPIYNELPIGGTLIWFVPEHKVFVDGRVEAYPQDFLLRVRDADLSGRYQELFDKYEIRCAVTHTGSVMARALLENPTMAVRFRDDDWSIFDATRAQ